MAYQWTPGEEVTADKLNQMGEAENLTVTYNENGTVATIVDDDTATTYTFAYDTEGRISTITDGTNTWTYTYDGLDRITNVTKTP
jgi:YD repeat-containing protein